MVIMDSEVNKAHQLQKALKKFPRARLMQYTKTTMAQASSFDVATYRTWKVHSQLGKIHQSVDICAGIGGDSIAAGLHWHVTCVEIDPEIFKMLVHNLAIYNVQNNVTCILGDVNDLLIQPEFIEKIKQADYVFFDPSRRLEGEENRTVKIEEYTPPLSLIENLLPLNSNICVKIAPGVDILHIAYPCDIEILSLQGEVKEIILWFGQLQQNPEKHAIIATKLPEKLSLSKELLLYNEPSKQPVKELGKFLYEPDPAVIKAHLINQLATIVDCDIIHPRIAYLTSNKFIKSPWLRSYRILDTCSIDIPAIKKKLEEYEINKVDCKARGLTLDLHAIQKQLRSPGDGRGLVIFTWVSNQKTAIISQYLGDLS